MQVRDVVLRSDGDADEPFARGGDLVGIEDAQRTFDRDDDFYGAPDTEFFFPLPR